LLRLSLAVIFANYPVLKGVRLEMKKHYPVLLLLASILIVAFAAVAGSGRGTGGEIPTPPAIGATIADFKLPNADGAEQSLSALKGKHGTILIFIATRCPVSNNYNERMEKLAQDYKAKGINVVGINSNVTEPIAEVKAHAAEKHLTFAILKDEGSKIADRLGATRTPEAYLLDANNKLVYRGRIDNSQRMEGVISNDLRDAADEILAGKPVTRTGADAFGCSIKRP
jgi:peroxiredoxin